MSPVRPKMRFEIFKRDNFTCVYCGRKPPEVELQADHKYPRSLGGPDTMDNLVTACRDCNQGKRNVPLAPPRLTYRLIAGRAAGPLDGQERTLEGAWPVLWVMRDSAGTFCEVADERITPPDDLWREGHLSYFRGGHAWLRAETPNDWTLLGLYEVAMHRREDEPPYPTLWWRDPAWLLEDYTYPGARLKDTDDE